MKCPYCKKEIDNSSVFCVNCGQNIGKNEDTITSDKYWSTIENDDKKRNQEHLKKSFAQKKHNNSMRAKKIVLFIVIAVIVSSIILVISNIISNNNEELLAVKENLSGQELKCSYSQTEAGFWIHYYYYKIKFNDDGTLDYYYLTTIGPAEEDDSYEHKGNYIYAIDRTILGDYIIEFANEKFTMEVSSNNLPEKLSYEK